MGFLQSPNESDQEIRRRLGRQGSGYVGQPLQSAAVPNPNYIPQIDLQGPVCACGVGVVDTGEVQANCGMPTVHAVHVFPLQAFPQPCGGCPTRGHAVQGANQAFGIFRVARRQPLEPGLQRVNQQRLAEPPRARHKLVAAGQRRTGDGTWIRFKKAPKQTGLVHIEATPAANGGKVSVAGMQGWKLRFRHGSASFNAGTPHGRMDLPICQGRPENLFTGYRASLKSILQTLCGVSGAYRTFPDRGRALARTLFPFR